MKQNASNAANASEFVPWVPFNHSVNMKNLCRIRDIQRSIATYEMGFEQKFGICLNEGMALCSLNESKTLTSGQLGDMLGITSSNMSKVLRSIESKGLVQRCVGENDRRQMCFSLTDKGKQLVSGLGCEDARMSDLLSNIIV